MVNLSFSVFVAVSFRGYPRPPVWIIIFLLIFGIGALRLLFMVGFGYTITLVTVLSAVLCITQALSLMCRRWCGTGVLKSWGISWLLALPVVIWVDIRFSVHVVDVNGKPVEVNIEKIELQAQPRSTFYRGYGNRLKKGVVYFGFCQWVMHREHWGICGDAVSPQGEMLRSENIYRRGNWGNWPLHVTIDSKTP